LVMIDGMAPSGRAADLIVARILRRIVPRSIGGFAASGRYPAKPQ
jgi:hypothetical protein